MSKRVRRTDVKDVERYLRDHVNGTVQTMSKKLRASPDTIDRHLETLMKEGLVERFESNGLVYYRLVAIGEAAAKISPMEASQRMKDEIDRFGMRWLREHGYTPESVGALSEEEHIALVERMNDDYMALRFPGQFHDYGAPSDLKTVDSILSKLMDMNEILSNAETKKSRGRKVSEDEWAYRKEMVIDYITEHPGAKTKEIAMNHKVDPRYGRMTSSVVHDLLMDMYSQDGSYVMYTKVENGSYSWFVKDVPADIAERIRKRLDSIRLHEIEVAQNIPLTEPQVFHLQGPDNGHTKDVDDEKVSEHQPEGESPSEGEQDAKETIFETSESEEEEGTEMTQGDMENYRFEILRSDKAVAGHVEQMCTEDQMKVAAKVLSKAANARVKVSINKYVFDTEGQA
ncbi:MAG: winged helix-turn-helix transcriptional regulator [Candidatus Methanomethylophilaceae archaeon]|nr:winged helix-turn-helix transcriptional regulator [Candidatus Methanomethylophilaceae archaeon]